MTTSETIDVERRRREVATARVIAIADIYVATNHIRTLLESRMDAIQRALSAGATFEDVTKALGGEDNHQETFDRQHPEGGPASI